MRKTSKNKIVLLLIGIIIFPIIITAVVLPRINIVNALNEDADIKFDIYDVYFADYSEDPELKDTYRFTLKILLDLRNGNKNEKLIIPRIYLDLGYLGKPIGKVWTMDELILEPFVDENSKSAGLLPLYITLYLEGESGIIEFINGMLQETFGAIEVDLVVYLGDLPISVDVKVGDLLGLLGGESGFDPMTLLDSFGLDLGNDNFALPEDYIFLKNNSYSSDLRSFLNIENYTIFRNQYEILLFGAKDKFTSINWKNATNGNNAVGNGNYTWEYWNGASWTDLSISDNTNSFSKSGLITFSSIGDWKKRKLIEDFFSMEYYYIRCRVIDLDDGIVINEAAPENSTYIRMNVKESHIGDYNPPSSSYSITEKERQIQEEIHLQSDFPELDEYQLPLDRGILKTDLDFEDYFAANGLDFSTLVDDFVFPPFLTGLSKAGQIPWVNVTDDDGQLEPGADIDELLDIVLGFLAVHEIDLMKFLIMAEFDWQGIFNYIGENFDGWIAPEGIDIITGKNIYSPLYEDTRYVNAILFSFVLMLGLFILLGVVFPYFAQKKVDQSFIFDEINNLDRYMDKVRKDMEKGITMDEIQLLKKATFKKKADISINQKEGDKK